MIIIDSIRMSLPCRRKAKKLRCSIATPSAPIFYNFSTHKKANACQSDAVMRHSLIPKASLHMQKDSPNAACLAILGANITFTIRIPVQNPCKIQPRVQFRFYHFLYNLCLNRGQITLGVSRDISFKGAGVITCT